MAKTVRPARRDEVAKVLALWGIATTLPGQTDDRASVAGLLDHDSESLLVAEAGGEIVGSLIVAWDGWRGNMYRLVVHPDARGRGVAGELIAAGDELLRRRGARRITALVDAGDAGAVATWESAGYALDEGTARFVKTHGERRGPSA